MTTVVYLTRDDWGGGPKRRGRHVTGIHGLIIHHTVYGNNQPYTQAQAAAHMRRLQTLRPDLGSEVPYSFVVFDGHGDTAIVAEGRGPNWSGAHTVGYNSSRYGLAIPGNTNNELVTAQQVDGINWIGQRWLSTTNTQTIPHSGVSQTACPGNNMRAKLHLVQPPFRTAPPPPEGSFMALSDNEQREILNKVRKIPSQDALAQVLVYMLGSEHRGHPVSVGNVTNDARDQLNGFTTPAFVSPTNSNVLYVTNWLMKVPVEEGSAHHNLIKYLIATAGGSTEVHPVDPQALAAIPSMGEE